MSKVFFCKNCNKFARILDDQKCEVCRMSIDEIEFLVRNHPEFFKQNGNQNLESNSSLTETRIIEIEKKEIENARDALFLEKEKNISEHVDTDELIEKQIREEEERLVNEEIELEKERERIIKNIQLEEERLKKEAELEEARLAAAEVELEKNRLAEEEKAKRKAKLEEARLVAEEQAKKEAELEEARLLAEEEAELEKARLVAEEQAKKEAELEEARLLAEEEAELEKARLAAEEQAKKEAELEEARLVEEKAELEKARLAAEEQAKKEAELEEARLAAEKITNKQLLLEQIQAEKEKTKQLLFEQVQNEKAEKEKAKQLLLEQIQIEKEKTIKLEKETEETIKLVEEATEKLMENDNDVNALTDTLSIDLDIDKIIEPNFDSSSLKENNSISKSKLIESMDFAMDDLSSWDEQSEESKTINLENVDTKYNNDEGQELDIGIVDFITTNINEKETKIIEEDNKTKEESNPIETPQVSTTTVLTSRLNLESVKTSANTLMDKIINFLTSKRNGKPVKNILSTIGNLSFLDKNDKKKFIEIWKKLEFISSLNDESKISKDHIIQILDAEIYIDDIILLN